MERGVLYLNTGGRHGLHLAVSTWSLRKHWPGPVTIVAGDSEGEEAAARVHASDPRFAVLRVDMDKGGGKGLQHCNKTLLPGLSTYGQTVFLDADTLVKGPLDALWPNSRAIGGGGVSYSAADTVKGGTPEFVLTRFADWSTKGRKIRGRVKAWEGAAPELAERMLRFEFPAINTGVMAWAGDGGKFAREWRELTLKNPIFMCDELAAQLIFPDHKVRVLDHRWNASVVFSIATLPSDQAVIWHGHGGKFLRRKSGQAIWRPEYEQARAAGWAGLDKLPEPEWRF